MVRNKYLYYLIIYVKCCDLQDSHMIDNIFYKLYVKYNQFVVKRVSHYQKNQLHYVI